MDNMKEAKRYEHEWDEREARRRKKLERQEKRVERLNEPLLVWLHKSFRVVTIAGTARDGGPGSAQQHDGRRRKHDAAGAVHGLGRMAGVRPGVGWFGHRPDDRAAQSRPGRLSGVPLLPQQRLVAIAGMILLGVAFAIT